eukprot:7191340-Prymnesium_polylepis.1
MIRSQLSCCRPTSCCRAQGIGVPKDMHETIFEPFVQGPKAGSGLGLSLCCSLIKLLGGELRLQSPAEKGGSIFSFCCLLHRDTPSAQVSTAVPRKDPPACLRILVADDVRLNRTLQTRRGKAALPTPIITEAASGREALAIIMKGDTD